MPAVEVPVPVVEEAPSPASTPSDNLTRPLQQAQSAASDVAGDGTAGPVIGLAVGGAAFLVLVAVAAICWRRRQHVAKRASGSASARHVNVTIDDTIGEATSTRDEQERSSPVGVTIGVGPHGRRAQQAVQAMRQWEWRSNLLRWEQQLGSGSFGIVHEVVVDGVRLAAKRVDAPRGSAQEAIQQAARTELEELLRREFRALQRVSHANCVQLVGVVLDHPSWACLLMELADRGSLRQRLDTSPDGIVGQPVVMICLAHDVASGLAYCHALTPQPLLHHDVKSANILLFSRDADGAARLTAKIADFGLAVGVSGTSTARGTARTQTNAAGGTLAYRGPETFNGSYTSASDVYSYAIVLWELLTGLIPWSRDANGRPYMEANVVHLVFNKKKRPELPAAPTAGTGPLAALMRRCWDQEPKKRPRFASIVTQLSALLPQTMDEGGTSSVSTSDNDFADGRALVDDLDVFISSRFVEARAEALALKAALEAGGLKVFLADTSPGGLLPSVLAAAIARCRVAVILASHSYGRHVNATFDTVSEMNYIISQRKSYYLVRMITPGANWDEPHTTMAFPPSIMYKLWMPGEPMPDGLADEIVSRVGMEAAQHARRGSTGTV